MNLGLRGWRGLILEEGRFSKYSLLLYMSLAGIFTAVCLKLHVWFLFLRNEPADCQGADSLPAARVLQPHMALSKLLWQNTCQHWNTAGIDTYVSQCLVYTLVPPVLLPLLGGRMKVFLFIVLLSLSLSAPLPSVDTSAPQQPKDSSLCIFPNCTRPKYVDGATTHPYCGRTHAEQGRQLGIVRKS